MRTWAERALRFVAIVSLALMSVPCGAATPVDTARLKPGEYVWHPELAPAGPVVAIVSLDEQRIYVYRNGVAIGYATISSGRRGYETPTGIYTVLEKDRDHHSNLYDDAPMPFMERLTWSGVALHGGALPGYPASHGCVRLPQAFAERLFSITQRGDTIVVADARVAPAEIVHPAVLAPIGTFGEPEPAADGDFEWDERAAAPGPVSVLVSLHDRRAYVLRNGSRIGSAKVDVSAGFSIGGTLLLEAANGYDYDAPSRFDPSLPRHRWEVYRIRSTGPVPSLDSLAAHLRVPDAFARAVYDILVPGTTVVLTDLPGVRNVGAVPSQPVLESR